MWPNNNRSEPKQILLTKKEATPGAKHSPQPVLRPCPKPCAKPLPNPCPNTVPDPISADPKWLSEAAAQNLVTNPDPLPIPNLIQIPISNLSQICPTLCQPLLWFRQTAAEETRTRVIAHTHICDASNSVHRFDVHRFDPGWGRLLGFGRQLPPQLTVGWRPPWGGGLQLVGRLSWMSPP